jgi:sterol desaturase/sphingolipid hydroxylase (fatty acid hydroxylase superfamily)
MNLDILVLALSPISIFTFAILEWLTFRAKNPIDSRVRVAISMEILSKSLGVFISWMFLLKLVNFVSPLEIVSISFLNMPKPINFLMSILIIDFFHYVIHRLHHSIPMLWRLHRTHHSDKGVNSISSFIHHPFETVSTFFIGIFMYVIFDIPVVAILCHSIFMVIHSPFSHTTLHVPRHIEKILSYVIVTPKFHRIHHSLEMKEGNSNFGIIFPYWDWLFGTFVSKTYAQMKAVKFGINLKETPNAYSLKEYLINPFIRLQEKS